MVLILILYTCFTLNMFLECFVMSHNPYPFLIAAMRMSGAGLLLLSSYAVQKKGITFKEIKPLISGQFFIYTLVLYVISIIAGAWSMQYIDPAKACFIFVLSPFMTALMLYFLENEKLSPKKIVGLLIGFAAVLPIVFASTSTQVHTVNPYFSMFSYMVFTIGIMLFAYGWILHKKLTKSIKIMPLLLSGASLTLSGVINAILALIFYGYRMNSVHLSTCFGYEIIGFISLTALSYGLYSVALKRYSVTFVSFASFMQPALGMLFSFVFLGKSISVISCLALVALGFGLYIFYQEELQSN